jgi:hypothetical protein
MLTLNQQIKELFPKIPSKQGWKHPEFVVSGKRVYRGRERYVAGYGHSRLYSHHMSGLVYDRVLGYGDTQEAAIAMMRAKLETQR